MPAYQSQFTVYKYTDASAPTLISGAGSLITILDACLVNGYGSKSPAGWTKAFTGTNKAAYLMGTGVNGAQQHYLRIRDDAPNNIGESRATGYEAMTDVDTGTPTVGMPQVGQGISGVAAVCIRKTDAGVGTRPWIVVADSRTLYLFTAPTTPIDSIFTAFAFGEFYSYIPSDAFRTYMGGRTTEAANNSTNDLFDSTSNVNATVAGNVVMRDYFGTPGALQCGKHVDLAKANSNARLLGGVANANLNGPLFLSPIWITESGGSIIRGKLRGIYQVCNLTAGFAEGDTFTATSDRKSRSFQIVKPTANGACLALETSNTVEYSD